MTEKRLLQVGDMVYEKISDKWVSRFKIDRVAAKYAFYKGYKFNRALLGNSLITSVPKVGHSTSYFIETPELKVEFNNQIILHKLSKFDYSVLTPDQRQRIIDIIKEGV